MTSREAANNLAEWIRLLYCKQCTFDYHEWANGDVFIDLYYDEFEIYIERHCYTIVTMGWYYEFKEAEDVCEFIEGWRLI